MPPKRGTPLADFRVPGFKDPTTEMPTPPSDHIPLWWRCAFRPERSPPYVWGASRRGEVSSRPFLFGSTTERTQPGTVGSVTEKGEVRNGSKTQSHSGRQT